MKGKRERLQVIYDILIAIDSKNGKIKPTHIMYKANLSHQMLNEYLKELISKEFIEEKKSKLGKTYYITPKGINYLNEYKKVIDFMGAFGLD